MTKLAYRVEMYMDKKEKLIEAIDNYAGYSSGCRTILKLLVELSIDNIAYISVMQLSEISSLSKEKIYQALDLFQKDNFIEKNKGKINTTKGITLKSDRFDQLVQFHKKKIELQEKYKKIYKK
jgi:predicted transcriptional regulator